MVPIPPSQTSHRKNRRRERPGARKRHALALAHEVAEGMSMASDTSFDFPLPNHHSHSQSRQHLNYDRNWKAWKTREEESRAAAMEREKHSAREQEKQAYTRLFGGEADDDEPRAFSISFASIKQSRKRNNNRITKPRERVVKSVRTRRPAFAMSLPLRPARTTQIEQLPLPAFDAEHLTTKTTQSVTTSTSSTQSLPTSGIWNNSATSFTLPFHPTPGKVSTSNNTSQQPSHSPSNDSKS